MIARIRFLSGIALAVSCLLSAGLTDVDPQINAKVKEALQKSEAQPPQPQLKTVDDLVVSTTLPVSTKQTLAGQVQQSDPKLKAAQEAQQVSPQEPADQPEVPGLQTEKVVLKSEGEVVEPEEVQASVAQAPDMSKKEEASLVEESFETAVETDVKALEAVDSKGSIEAKRKDCIDLVNRAVDHMLKTKLNVALGDFSFSEDFVEGDLYIFVFERDGRCVAHGQEAHLIWKNLHDIRDSFGVYIIQEVIKEALNPQENGWVTYQWRNATKISYVRQVLKDGKVYVIGTGYYPHKKVDSVVNLVKAAVALFYDVIKLGNSEDIAFSIMSYPKGRFVQGSLYLYALDFEGFQVAHGERVGRIGSNGLNYQDEQGTYVNREIIKKLKEKGSGGVWVDYVSKGAPKRAYAERVVNKQGREFFIGCGYHPDADREHTVDLVRRGAQFLKRNGIEKVARIFSSLKNDEFRYGDLFLYVYDPKGKCLAHGRNEEFIGKNRFDARDEDGFLYVQALIKEALETGSGWVEYKENNSFFSAYVEKITVGKDVYIIGSGVYPISKRETMELLAKSGASYLRTAKDPGQAFELFTDRSSRFIRGDLDLFVFDYEGFCYVYKDNYTLIHRNLMNLKDEDGREYIKMFINAARRGPQKVTYKINKRTCVAHVEGVQRGGVNYVVGSDFFL